MFSLLALFGIITGFIAGFFGVGGGMVLIPMLLFAGFSMKSAVAISILQMVFTSVFGSFLNYKKNKSILKDGLVIGTGGFIGGLLSGLIVSSIDGIYLQYLFLFIVSLAIYGISISSVIMEKERKEHSKLSLLIIGFFIGLIAMSIGVGGSVMLTPILVGYMYYNLKDASSLGLFFVVFSSIAGFISLSLTGHMLYFEGTIVGVASLIGVYFGIKIKNMTNISSYKKLILTMYVIILISVIIKL
ncbi:MAG: sulfite exporter TauE/SafE family protein [Campylobacterota bacterium]|nr:sulfite exporter TauE/SafE family protein [Campylobacterota bacterium]